MKTCLGTALLGAVLLAGGAAAEGRPDARRMSCDQVQSLIRERGAVVLTTGQYTYDRYVDNRFQCFTLADVAVRTYIEAADTESCRVYRCKTVDPIDRRLIQ
jgi:hypothetical protein